MMTGPFSGKEESTVKKPCPSVDKAVMGRNSSRVRKAFKMCDILNALDGTEDDKVYADDMPELPDYDMAMEKEIVENTMTVTSFVNSPHKTAPLGATT